jgi:radical SAM-linked protein
MTKASTAAIRFRIAGALRFLSHAETARLWQRACARAALPVRYSQGFNPHPRMSLPLPRPVGVEAQEELLVVKVDEGTPREDRAAREASMKQALAERVPPGLDVVAVDLLPGGMSFHPKSAEYILPVRGADLVESLRGEIARVMECERCMVERASGEGRATRRIDVRPFLQSVRLEEENLIVQHRTDGAGSIRVDEILQLFGLQTQDLAGPIRRTNVVWETIQPEDTLKKPCRETRAEDLEDGT